MATNFPALSIRQPNIAGQLAQAQQIVGMRQEQQVREVQLEQARQVQQSNSTIMSLLARNNGDYDKTYEQAAATGQVLPAALESLRNASLEYKTKSAQLTGEQLNNHAKFSSAAANEIDSLKDLASQIGNDPSKRQQLFTEMNASLGRLSQLGGPNSMQYLEPIAANLLANPTPENFGRVEVMLMGEKWANENEQSQRALQSMPTVAQAQARTTAELTSAQSAASKSVMELNALPQQLQDAHKKNVAETAQASAATALQTEQLHQLRQNEQYIRNPDPTGFTTPLPVNEYNKRYDSFTQGNVYKQVQSVQGSYQQFGTILNDLDSNKPLTGAASVVALFDAVGISATPLAGKGFRINSNVIGEHVGARGLDQSVLQKVLSLKQGDIITPSQVRDYASIAANVYKQTYINAADEAHREGLPADFLPRGGGKLIDSTTAKIYANVVAHERPELASNPGKLQQAAMKAARDNGWRVDDGGVPNL